MGQWIIITNNAKAVGTAETDLSSPTSCRMGWDRPWVDDECMGCMGMESMGTEYGYGYGCVSVSGCVGWVFAGGFCSGKVARRRANGNGVKGGQAGEGWHRLLGEGFKGMSGRKVPLV